MRFSRSWSCSAAPGCARDPAIPPGATWESRRAPSRCRWASRRSSCSRERSGVTGATLLTSGRIFSQTPHRTPRAAPPERRSRGGSQPDRCPGPAGPVRLLTASQSRCRGGALFVCPARGGGCRASGGYNPVAPVPLRAAIRRRAGSFFFSQSLPLRAAACKEARTRRVSQTEGIPPGRAPCITASLPRDRRSVYGQLS